MLRHVICIKESEGDAAQRLFETFGVMPPVKDSPYTVIGCEKIQGLDFFILKEYPPVEHIPTGRMVLLSFQKEFFAEIPDDLVDDIEEALKAPAPQVRELEHELDTFGYIFGGYGCRHNWSVRHNFKPGDIGFYPSTLYALIINQRKNL